MESDKQKPEEEKPAETPAAAAPEPPKDGAAETAPSDSSLPQDALEKTNEELAAEEGVVDATNANAAAPDAKAEPPKKPNALKKFFKKVDVYLLGAIFILIIAGVFSMVSFLNSKKTPKAPTVSAQTLTPNALKALSSSNVSINNSAQTLTVQGNAVFDGQVLIRSNLSVAGNIQAGGTLDAPTLAISGTANLPATQANSLQVAQNTVVQGNTSLATLNVSGASTFNEPVTASEITVSTLILSGNAVLNIPNHLAFTGPSPARSSITASVLGSSGTASVNGSDTSGVVNVNTGGNPTPGCFISITFAEAFTKTPHVIISPVNVGAGESEFYSTLSSSGFSVCMNTPPANQDFAFDYFVTD
jgi:cytoskeletal protein CcmA (bactofilin family)